MNPVNKIIGNKCDFCKSTKAKVYPTVLGTYNACAKCIKDLEMEQL